MSIMDAIYEAMLKAKRAAYEPDTVLIHPKDKMRLILSAEARWAIQHLAVGPDRVLGMPLVATVAVPEGTVRVMALVAESTFDLD